MSDKKISALTAATTPLAGSEVLPLVQSGVTKKVSVANLTAGRAVDVKRLIASGDYDANDPSVSSTPIVKINEGGALSLWVGGKAYTYMWMQAIQDDGSNNLKQLNLQPLGGGVNVGLGDMTINNGNLVIGTTGKGIDFSATSQAGGMTSELLNDYEEGTWTPAFATGISGVGYASRSGTYTKVGNIVTISGQISTNAGTATSDQVSISGLPFAVSGAGGAFFTYLNTGVAASLWIASGFMYGYKATGGNLNGTDLASASNTIVYFTGQYTAA